MRSLSSLLRSLFSCQRNSAQAVRKTEAQHLECFVADETMLPGCYLCGWSAVRWAQMDGMNLENEPKSFACTGLLAIFARSCSPAECRPEYGFAWHGAGKARGWAGRGSWSAWVGMNRQFALTGGGMLQAKGRGLDVWTCLLGGAEVGGCSGNGVLTGCVL